MDEDKGVDQDESREEKVAEANPGTELTGDPDVSDNDDIRRNLGTVASGLAEQLTTITEEMNKIRSELYGESGLGGITKELNKLKFSGLAGLLDPTELEELSGRAAGQASASRGSSRQSGTPKGSPSNAGMRDRRDKVSTKHSDDLEDIRRKLLIAKMEEKKRKELATEIPFVDVLMFFLLLLVAMYVFSPTFRAAIQDIVSPTESAVWNADGEEVL